MKKTILIILLTMALISCCMAQAYGNEDTDRFSKRDLDGTYDPEKAVSIVLEGDKAVCSAKEVQLDGSTVTIIDEGVFVISGTLEDGMIHVLCENEDKVQIVLENASVRSASCAPIYVQQADKVFITLAEGSENSLSNGGTFEPIDENNIDAVIFSKEDLTLNGTGALTISSPAGHGIVGKDDLAVTRGKYDVDAAGHGIAGKDSLAVTGCEMTIRAGKDGLHCENNEDADKGSTYIGGGSFEITCRGDGLSASGNMDIEGGAFKITSGGGSTDAVRPSNEKQGGFRGRGYQPVESAETADTPSAKGIKAAKLLAVTGGSFDINASDDGVHSDGDIAIGGGIFSISTGDDGIHADDRLDITGGSVDITRSYEGMEATHILISDGDIALTADDDGINAGGGNDASGFGGRGGDMFSSDGSSITIAGGSITVNAEGDGIDSNGTLEVSGGCTWVFGPTKGGNGALDYGGSARITGGTFIALGSGQMASNFSTAENQGAMLVFFDGIEAGTDICLTDGAGQEILTVTAGKQCACAVISCPAIQAGATYVLTAGEEAVTVIMDSPVYGNGMGMHGGFGGAGMNGGPGRDGNFAGFGPGGRFGGMEPGGNPTGNGEAAGFGPGGRFGGMDPGGNPTVNGESAGFGPGGRFGGLEPGGNPTGNGEAAGFGPGGRFGGMEPGGNPSGNGEPAGSGPGGRFGGMEPGGNPSGNGESAGIGENNSVQGP